MSGTRISSVFFTRMNFFAAGCSSMPADCSRNTKAAALPSMIGASGPSISTMQLSTPRPHSADMMCSTVETNTPDPSPSTVASSVAVTARAVARSSRSGSPLMPQRTKMTPESASAGLSVRVTGRPE